MRRNLPTTIVLVMTVLGLTLAACTSSNGPGDRPSSKPSASPDPTSSPLQDHGNGSFAYGSFVTFSSAGFRPKTLLSPMGTPIVWRNTVNGPIVVHFDNYGEPITSGSIPPGGTWSFNPNAQLSIAYHTVWKGKRYAAFVQTQLVGNSGP